MQVHVYNTRDEAGEVSTPCWSDVSMADINRALSQELTNAATN